MSVAAPGGAPRVVVEPSDTVLHNHGDAAMLQVALDRLRDELPRARIEVFTEESERLSARCPTVVPLPIDARRAATGGLDALRRLLPAAPGGLRVLRPLARWTSEAFPNASRTLARWGLRVVGGGDPGAAHRRQLAGAHLLVVAGMGGLTDAFHSFAAGLLDSIEHALDAGVPVALMGQGIGPLADRGLRKRAARVLPRAALIALREGRASPRLLAELGVPAERIVVTGDDAISFAWAQCPVSLGDGLGVNVRIADYAGTARRDVVGPVATALRTAAATAIAPLVPLPIACHGGDDDAETIRVMLGAATAERVTSPDQVLDRVARCRVVVTGSYHAGVFALAMGVPVVALVASPYYHDKMRGLAHQFGADGCRVVALDDPDAPTALVDAVATQWADAERLRPALLAAAECQAAAGRHAYGRLAGIGRRGAEAEA
ncbi:MAG TPA: polysaccharide pyruvyl transferase family protein [Burkholderiales bacterium]|nr:polysaccharide pyruvyl transferase family protein [Burkholderiales bacterium]